METEILMEHNIWWKGKEKIEEDYDIIKWKNKKHKWVPGVINKIQLQPFSLHFFLGPRQVGKTTAVKLLIRKLLEEKLPTSIFYFNCEELSDYRELSDVLQSYLDFRENLDIKSSYIFLDEITSPDDWNKSIKSFIDKGKLKDDIVLLTGSSSINLKRQTELFPGRRGHGKNFLLLPLSFREFIKIYKPEIFKKISAIKELSTSELRKKTTKAMIFIKELNYLFEKYFQIGGFPLSLEEKEESKEVYLNWIKTDILKAERSDTIAREVIKCLIEKMQTPISWEKIASEIEIKSPKTVSAYVEIFRSIYCILLLYYIDISKKRLKFGKNKKIHVLDPLLLEIFEDWTLSRIKNKNSVLAESCVVSHLARYGMKKNSLNIDENIFYWRNSTEIDAIIKEKDYVGIEVKWTDKFDVKKHLKNQIILAKNKFDIKNLVIPIAVFLSVLDV